MIAFLMTASNAQAQTGDWQAVENMMRGTRISVKTKHRVGCIFERATENALVCERTDRGSFRIAPREIEFDRRSVREVRLERSDDANGAVGALIGAGADAALGASTGNKTTSREGGVLLLGATGAIAGWFIGSEFHILHGEIIYKR